MTQKHTGFLITGLIVLGLIIFFILPNGSTEEVVEEPNETETTTSEGEVGEIIIGEGGSSIEGGTVEIIDSGSNIAVGQPNLDRPINIPDIFQGEAEQIMLEKITDAISEVKKDPTSFKAWLTLGNIRNQTQDYEGALEIYEYLVTTNTETSLVYTNIGNVYHYHLPNYPKAEANYLQAIEITPGNENVYKELHTLYRNVYKTDTNLAEQTLLDGLEQKPNSINLMILLADYYAHTDQADKQLEYLKNALDEATRIGDEALASRLSTQISGRK